MLKNVFITDIYVKFVLGYASTATREKKQKKGQKESCLGVAKPKHDHLQNPMTTNKYLFILSLFRLGDTTCPDQYESHFESLIRAITNIVRNRI